MNADFMHWGMRPDIFSLGPLTVRWYGLLFATAFIVGYQLISGIYKRAHKPTENLDGLLIYVAVGTIVGARLGHCLFYDPEFYLSHPLEILKIWRGGLASHGGAMGVLIGVYLYCRQYPTETYLWVLDRLAIAAALAACFIRLGNFFNSEIVGVPTQLPWAIVFERIDRVPRHPVQLYESVAYGLIFIILMMAFKKQAEKPNGGFLTGLFFILVFVARIALESVKTQQAAYADGLTISVGQWLSVPFIIAGVILVARAKWRASDRT